MSDEIKLLKVGETEVKDLRSRGIYMILFDKNIIFAKRFMGKFIPLDISEQEKLKKQYVNS